MQGALGVFLYQRGCPGPPHDANIVSSLPTFCVCQVNLRSELDLAVEEMERAQARLALLEKEHEAMLEKVDAWICAVGRGPCSWHDGLGAAAGGCTGGAPSRILFTLAALTALPAGTGRAGWRGIERP